MEKLNRIFENGTTLTDHEGQLLFVEWLPNRMKKFYNYNSFSGLQPESEGTFSKAIAGQYFEKVERQLGGKIHDFSFTKGTGGERYFCNYQSGIIKGL